LGLRPGEVVLSLGTSGTVYSVAATPSADPSGVVVGLADADGAYLPLACTLNCTQAVDRLAALLHLDRDDVLPAEDVIVLPYLDGERTPYLPHAAGLVMGLRHATEPGQVLMAAYEGAIAALLEAAELVTSGAFATGGSDALILIGGGAQGAAWRDTVRRLSGRSIVVPNEVELVALGAAVQASAALSGETHVQTASRWLTRRGLEEPAVDMDRGRVARIAAAARLGRELEAFYATLS